MRLITNIALIFIFSLVISAKDLKWYSFNEGTQKAAKENKIILVDLYTDWCGWCKKMDEETYSNTEIIDQMNKDFVAIKLNPEKSGKVSLAEGEMTNTQFASALGVRSYPSTAFFTSDLKLIEVISGYYEPKDMKTLLEYMSEKLYEKLTFQDYRVFETVKNLAAEKKNTPKLNFILGYYYLIFFNDSDMALQNFKTALENKLENKEIYAALSLSAPSDPAKSKEWLNKAKSLGYKSESELTDLVIEYVKELYANQ